MRKLDNTNEHSSLLKNVNYYNKCIETYAARWRGQYHKTFYCRNFFPRRSKLECFSLSIYSTLNEYANVEGRRHDTHHNDTQYNDAQHNGPS
jgi:hypothetical protein